jgi:hypothetical protein
VPGAIVGSVGVTVKETRDTVIVRGAVPATDPDVAVMTMEPFNSALTSPVLEIDARALLETLQVTELPRF